MQLSSLLVPEINKATSQKIRKPKSYNWAYGIPVKVVLIFAPSP
jgi:hypothetical protein